MAVTSNQPDFIPLLINGRPLKSLNQFYNQRRAKLQSLLKGNRQSSQRIRRLTRCRNQKIDDYLHKASHYLVKLLVDQEITTLVIGKNDGWKQEVNLGKVNNQKFVTIPHARLIDMISYKCQLSREAQLFVGWVSALRNPCGRWVSYFNPTYVHLIFNSTHLLSRNQSDYSRGILYLRC
jgi:putative transposase